MPTSYFSSNESNISVRNRARLSNILTTNKERTHEYKKWSENATIVKYRSETKTYDILISLINSTNSTRKNNRVMRNVTSIIPTESHIFQPGDQVLIGYVSDKRESPIILGFREKPDQAQARAAAGGDAATQPPCDLRCYVVSTLGEILIEGQDAQFECSSDGADGTGEMRFRVECAVGNVRWNWSGTSNCSTDECFSGTPNKFKNGREFTLKKVACTHAFASNVAAYCIVRTGRYTDATLGRCNLSITISYYNCDGTELGGLQRTSSVSAGSPCSSSPASACGDFDEDTFEVSYAGSEVSNVYALLPACTGAPSDPQVITDGGTILDLADVCGWFEAQYSGVNIELETDADTLASMRANGCCPCSMIDETVVTATDSLGRSCSFNIKFKNANVNLESTYPDGMCGS